MRYQGIQRCCLLVLVSGVPGLAAAQTPAMSGLTAGFVFDPAVSGLRPLLGTPGASTLGDPLRLGIELDQAAVSSEKKYALATSGNGLNLILIRQLTGAMSRQSFSGGTAPIDSIRLAPRAQAAVLYRSALNTLQVVTGLPDNAAFAEEIDLSPLGGALSAMAVNDAGFVLAAAAAGDSSPIFLVGRDGSARLVSTIRHASALAWVDGRDALVADDRGHTVYLLQNVIGVPATLPLAGEAQGLKGPIGLELSRDRRRAFVINAGSAEVVAIDLVNGTSARYACPCAPTGIAPLSGSAVFRLTDLSNGPLWVFDGDLPEPRIVFVPPRADSAIQPGSKARQ